MSNGCECAPNWVCGLDVLPVFCRKFIERQKRVAVLNQLGNGLLVFHAVGFDEEIEGCVGFGFRFRLPDIVQMALGFGLHRLGHRVQHVAGLVEPAPLLTS